MKLATLLGLPWRKCDAAQPPGQPHCPTVLLSVGDWLLSVTEWEVIFLLRPITVWVIMGKNQTPRAAADKTRERPTSTAMMTFIQKHSAVTWHVSCVVFWAHKIMSWMQSSSTPAQYWCFLRLINYESTDPWYSIWHLLFPLFHQFPCSVSWELSVLLQRTICECACVVVKTKIMMSVEMPLAATRHQVTPTKKPKKPQTMKDRKRKSTGISHKLCNLLGVLSFNIEAYFCISASSLVESEMVNCLILRWFNVCVDFNNFRLVWDLRTPKHSVNFSKYFTATSHMSLKRWYWKH